MGIDEPGIGVHLAVGVSELTGLRPREDNLELLRFRDFRAQNHDYFFSDRYREAWREGLRDLILGRLSAQVRDVHGAWRDGPVVLKEPHGSSAADMLVELLPRSRVLFLLRDGRDVVDSELDAASSGSWAIERLVGFEAADQERLRFIRERAQVWVARTRLVGHVYDRHPEELRLRVRYEDLLQSPAEHLAQIFSWLGTSIETPAIRRIVEELSVANAPAGSRGPGKFVRAATPGLWQTNLSDDEQTALESVQGPTLRHFGYR